MVRGWCGSASISAKTRRSASPGAWLLAARRVTQIASGRRALGLMEMTGRGARAAEKGKRSSLGISDRPFKAKCQSYRELRSRRCGFFHWPDRRRCFLNRSRLRSKEPPRWSRSLPGLCCTVNPPASLAPCKIAGLFGSAWVAHQSLATGKSSLCCALLCNFAAMKSIPGLEAKTCTVNRSVL